MHHFRVSLELVPSTSSPKNKFSRGQNLGCQTGAKTDRTRAEEFLERYLSMDPNCSISGLFGHKQVQRTIFKGPKLGVSDWCQNRSYKSGEIFGKASPADLNRVSRAM